MRWTHGGCRSLGGKIVMPMNADTNHCRRPMTTDHHILLTRQPLVIFAIGREVRHRLETVKRTKDIRAGTIRMRRHHLSLVVLAGMMVLETKLIVDEWAVSVLYFYSLRSLPYGLHSFF